MANDFFLATIKLRPDAMKAMRSFASSLIRNTRSGSVQFKCDGTEVMLSLYREYAAPKVVGGTISEHLDLKGTVEDYSPAAEPVEMDWRGDDGASFALIVRALLPGLEKEQAKRGVGTLSLEVWPETYRTEDAERVGYDPAKCRPSSITFRHEAQAFGLQAFGQTEVIHQSLKPYLYAYQRFHRGERIERVDLTPPSHPAVRILREQPGSKVEVA